MDANLQYNICNTAIGNAPTQRECVRILLAVDSFGEGQRLIHILEADHYIADFRMVFSHEHLCDALMAEQWDVVVFRAESSLFSLDATLSMIRALRLHKSAEHMIVLVIASPQTLSAEQALVIVRAGADDIIFDTNLSRVQASIQQRYSRIFARKARAEEQRTLHLLHYSCDIVSLIDAHLGMVYHSPAFYRLFGYTQQDVIGASIDTILHPDDQTIIHNALHHILDVPEEQKQVYMRVRHQHTGEYRLIESMWINCIHIADIQGILLNSRDITARFHPEHGAREREEQYKTLIDSVSEGVMMVDVDCKCIIANSAAERAFGVEPGALNGRTLYELFPHNGQGIIEQDAAEQYQEATSRYEVEIVRPNGTRRWQAITVIPRLDSRGVRIGTILIINDMTERKFNEEANVLFSQFLERRISERTEALKRANTELKHEIAERKRMEEMLLQSGERLNSLLKNSSDVITIVEENGDIIYESPASEKVFGFEPFERIGKNFLENVHPDYQETVRTFFRCVAHEPYAVQTVECLYLSALHHEYQWIEITGSNQIENIAVGGIVLNSHDISSRKAAEQELKKALTQEKELNDLKSRFIRMVSHEFRTPLTVINSSAEILRMGVGTLSLEKQSSHIERIIASVSHIEYMLHDILTIARGEAGKTYANFAPVHLQALCEDVIHNLSSTSGSEGRVIFRYHTTTTEPPILDEKLVRSILTNLLSNAIKYSDADVECTVECSHTGVLIQVSDSGIGIPEEDQKYMFEPFHRGQNAVHIQGTGLGMSVVKYAVDAHGGTIRLTSRQNVGTTFTVRLPHDARLASKADDRNTGST
ncbi:MAG: PAS domain-containing sensor histidine kinase [Bacteroidota bacterium]|nr:PAS domain-containing sensor histidine kinase [Candidatus Kapabacteria bacterium]MDW8220354.1 PAS domain-containing sensor histidine kinase [Bacteroidota bacterium]